MQNYLIETDEHGRELVSHGDPLFPLACYDEYFSKFVLGEVPWHWHEEIEIVLVYEASTKVEYVGGSTILNPGECIFINSNMLHRFTQVGAIDCHIINFVFKPEFIGGRSDSRIYRDYILPICSNEALAAIKFTSAIPWQSALIDIMKEAFNLFTDAPFGYEMLVRAKLSELWTLICSNKQELFTHATQSVDDTRISTLIKYIHQHYSDKLTVPLLASVVNISESECYRLFKRTLDIPPNDYILNHRLQLGASRLIDSDISIITLTLELGFGSASYFSKKFKEKYQCTPRQFRALHKKDAAN